MSQITSTFRITIIALMITSGAINTIGNATLTQPTNSRTSRWCLKGSSSNTFSIHTCRYQQLNLGHDNVLRRSARLPHLYRHAEAGSINIQDENA